jgi:hypothetical protein
LGTNIFFVRILGEVKDLQHDDTCVFYSIVASVLPHLCALCKKLEPFSLVVLYFGRLDVWL